MADILKQEYDVGFLNDDSLAWYVRHNAITASDFKYITGADYQDNNSTSATKG